MIFQSASLHFSRERMYKKELKKRAEHSSLTFRKRKIQCPGSLNQKESRLHLSGPILYLQAQQ
jgi:hypothetical protein